MTAHKLKWITFPIVMFALSATFLFLSPADSATLGQVNTTSKQTLANKTLTAPVLSGTVTGTYTLAGTPTITAPAISNPMLSGGGVFGATYTGTYTLAGTPTLTTPVFSGSITGTYNLAVTPTLTAPILSGTATGTYTLGGTPTITAPTITGTVLSSGLIKIGDPAMYGYVDNALNLQSYGNTGSSAPTGIQQANRFIAQSKGDNATFRGLVTGLFEARDRTDVTGSNKGVLYALSLSVVPSVARNNVPYDDVDGLTIQNSTGTAGAKATDAIYIAPNTSIFPLSSEWYSLFTADANADKGIVLGGRLASYGIDLALANIVSSDAIRLPNATYIYARNAANSGDVRIAGLDADNIVQLGGTRVSGTHVNNWFGTTAPTTQSGATYTVGFDDNYLTFAGSGCTVTLPAAGSFSGRLLTVRTTVAFTVISASSNVVPLIGGSAGTAILQATAGKWAKLVSDGTVWQIMEGN